MVAVVIVIVVVVVVIPLAGGVARVLLVSPRGRRQVGGGGVMSGGLGGGEEWDEAVPGVALDCQVATAGVGSVGLPVADGWSAHGEDGQELCGGRVTARGRAGPVREDDQLRGPGARHLGCLALLAAVLLLGDVDGHRLLGLLLLRGGSRPAQLGLRDDVVHRVGVAGAAHGAADGADLVRSDQLRPDQTVARLGRDELGRGGRGGGWRPPPGVCPAPRPRPRAGDGQEHVVLRGEEGALARRGAPAAGE